VRAEASRARPAGRVQARQPRHLLHRRRRHIKPLWCGAVPETELDCTVQLRAHGNEHRARVRVVGDEVEVDLIDPAFGIAPGQACVIYDGTRVVGSGTISQTRRVLVG
jgi:tRNA-specific 2-thiouridylase